MTSNAGGTGRILGSLRLAEGRGVVRMEDRYDTDIDDLWTALTDPGRLARWLGDFEGDFRAGGEFQARFFASGWEGTGRVKTCDPPRRLVVVTKGTQETDEHTIEATLRPDAGQTILIVEQSGMPADLLPDYGAGIQVHVEDLASHLAGRDCIDAQARWDELLPAYQELAAKID